MRTSNPALSEKKFTESRANLTAKSGTMTVQGAATKSLFLIVLVVVGAMFSWSNAFPQGWGENIQPVIPSWYFPVLIGTFLMSLVIIFKPTTAPFLAPAYAILEGMALGALSAIFEFRYPGIVFQAVLGTFGTFGALLLIYKLRIIRVSQNLALGIAAATGGIALTYVIDLVMRFFDSGIPVIHESSTLGIAFSLFVVAVAALNLVLDFDFIERGEADRAPKYMEWYAAFGLLVTLVWLYIEFLRLLSKTKK